MTRSGLRLTRVRWRHHGIDTPEQMRERHQFLGWLCIYGARVHAWQLTWEVRWP